MALYLEGKTAQVTEPMLHRALRFGTINFKLVPVICGSAFKNKGVQLMLDAVVNYLPSPLDIPPVKGKDPTRRTDPRSTRKASDDEPFSALAFKILNDPHGNLTFFRVYSGKIRAGTMVLNSTRDKRERIGRILRMHANKREEVHGGRLGQHLRGRRPARHAHRRHALRREAPDPAREDDLPRAGHLDRHRAEDEGRRREARRRPRRSSPRRIPSFRMHTDEESGQTIISGMGELHLEIIVDRLQARVQGRVERRQARGRLPRGHHRRRSTCEYKYAKQSGGRGQYGHV